MLSASLTPNRREILLFFILACLGGISGFISVNVPYTEVYIEGRYAFGFMGFALLSRLWSALLLAGVLSITGFCEMPLYLCSFGNLMYSLPALALIRCIYGHILVKQTNIVVYGVAWFVLILVCYQAFTTPVVWFIVALLRNVDVWNQVLSGWIEQPFLIESILVGVVSTSGMVMLRSIGELRRSRREMAIMLDSIGDGMVAAGPRGNILRMNAVAEHLTGWKAEDAMGMSIDDVFRIVNVQTREPVKNPIDLVIEQGVTKGLANDTCLISRLGTERLIADSAAPVRESDGRLIGVIMIFRDVTQEYQNNARIRKSEDLLRKVEGIAHLGSWELVLETGELTWSDETYRIFGLQPRECDANYELFLDIVHPDDREAVNAAYFDSLKGGGDSYEIEHRIVRRGSGEIRYVHERCVHAGDRKSGRVLRSVGMIHDITERKRTEEQLRFQSRVLDQIQDCITVTDLEGRITYVNDAERRMMGRKPEETVGRHVSIYGEDPSAGATQEEILQKTKEAGEWRGEVVNFSAEGDKVVLDCRTHVVLNEHGDKVALCGISTDVTDRKRAEAERERLLSAIEQSGESILITDSQGVIQYVNPAFESITGFNRREAAGRTPRILKSGRQDSAFYADLWETISSGRTWRGRLVDKRKDGTIFTVEASISPVRDSLGRIIDYVAVKRDITEQIRVKEEKDKLESQFQQSRKLESVGRLAGGVAHDLNNLLTPILGYASVLMEDLEKNDLRRESAEEILYAGMRARDLIRQLLAFGRKQLLEFKPVNLNEVLEKFQKLLIRTIREDVAIRIVPKPYVPLVNADIGQLEQVILNLAINAQDAMPHGGALVIETDTAELDQAYADIHQGVKPGSYVLLSVTDSGRGMDDHTRKNIFEPFFTTKSRDEGAGLGLSTVYGIVKQHGGNIWVYSEPDEGTTFKIYLPVSKATVAVRESEVQKTSDARGVETILVVEDNEHVRELACTMLQRMGYKVLAAENGKKALEILNNYTKHIHLILADVIMPEMSGKDLVGRILPDYPDMKVLYMSGYSDNVIAERGVLDPGVHFIQKPFTMKAITEKVREVLDLER